MGTCDKPSQVEERPANFREIVMPKRRKNYQNTMRYLRQRYGMCSRCGAERGDGSTKWLCKKCKEFKRQYNQELRDQRKRDGQCRDCNQPRGENGTAVYCRPCADKVNHGIATMRNHRVANGRCRHCNQPLRHRHSICTPCLASWAEKGWNGHGYQKRRTTTGEPK